MTPLPCLQSAYVTAVGLCTRSEPRRAAVESDGSLILSIAAFKQALLNLPLLRQNDNAEENQSFRQWYPT